MSEIVKVENVTKYFKQEKVLDVERIKKIKNLCLEMCP